MVGNTQTRTMQFESHTPPELIKDFEILRARLQSNPRDVPTLNSIGLIYAQNNQIDEAIKVWRHAMRINPSYNHLYNNLGSALKQLGRIDEARLVFKTGLAYSQSHWIHYNLGVLEIEAGNTANGVNHLRACLNLNPGFRPALQQLAELGYHVQLPPTAIVQQPTTLGSYKPPVAPKKPGEKEEKKQPSTPARAIERFKPLTLQQSIDMISRFKANEQDRFIALTFDDGPHQTNTTEILDILKQHNVNATFFVLGSRAKTYPEIISRMANEGHDVGNHSWNHRSLTSISSAEALEDLTKTANLISGLTSKPCILVRPPYGQFNRQVRELIHSQGWHKIMWDSDSRDWENRNPDRIMHRVMHSVRPGSIILFHDIHPGAARMLPTLIQAFKANNYRFLTISEMLEQGASS